MKSEKTYKKTGIKITKIPMKKTRQKNIIKCRTKRSAGWREPATRISSVYQLQEKKISGQTMQDSVSTNKMCHSREFGKQ